MITLPTDPWLDRWVAAGLLSPEQARAIHLFEVNAGTRVLDRSTADGAGPAPGGGDAPDLTSRFVPPDRAGPLVRWWSTPSIAEALGYLGGVLALVGLVSLVATYWTRVPLGGRLGLLAAGAIAFAVAGAAVAEAEGPALARLRWLLWTLSSAVTAVFAGFLAVDGWGIGDASLVALIVAVAVGVESGVMWAGRFRPLQLAVFLTAISVAVGTAVGQIATAGVAGLAVWLTGAVMLVLGLRHVRVLPTLHVFAGAVSLCVGAALTMTSSMGVGLLFLVATAGVLVTVALVPGLAPAPVSQVVVGVVGLVVAFQSLPQVIAYFAHGAGVATGLTIWLLAGVLTSVGASGRVRANRLVEAAGGVALVGGAAVIGVQSVPLAVSLGLVTALLLLGFGARPDRLVLSLAGSAGLLVNVPWTISYFFPGEGRAPFLILVTGVLIIGIAMVMARRITGPPRTV